MELVRGTSSTCQANTPAGYAFVAANIGEPLEAHASSLCRYLECNKLFRKSEGFGKHRLRLEGEFEVGAGKPLGCSSVRADQGSGDFGKAKKIMRFGPATLDTCKVERYHAGKAGQA